MIAANLVADLIYGLLDPRCAHEDLAMSDTTAPRLSSRQLSRRRRGAAFRRSWQAFCAHRSGLVGLGVLTFFVAVALAAPVLASSRRAGRHPGHRRPAAAARAAYPLGTDETGRSVLLLTLWGARISLLVGVTATLLAMGIGTLVGIAAGHFGGWFTGLLMRVTDWLLVMPLLVLAIALAAVLGAA